MNSTHPRHTWDDQEVEQLAVPLEVMLAGERKPGQHTVTESREHSYHPTGCHPRTRLSMEIAMVRTVSFTNTMGFIR